MPRTFNSLLCIDFTSRGYIPFEGKTLAAAGARFNKPNIPFRSPSTLASAGKVSSEKFQRGGGGAPALSPAGAPRRAKLINNARIHFITVTESVREFLFYSRLRRSSARICLISARREALSLFLFRGFCVLGCARLLIWLKVWRASRLREIFCAM